MDEPRPSPGEDKVDGLSLAQLLRDPTLTMLPGRDWALSQYPRCPAPGIEPADYCASHRDQSHCS
jgi:hypothetical protein